MRLITLSQIRTSRGGSDGMVVNSEQIESVKPEKDGDTDYSEVVLVSGRIWLVQETPNEIKRLTNQEA